MRRASSCPHIGHTRVSTPPVRNRPAQPREAFRAQTEAVLAHDCSAALEEISAPDAHHVRGSRPHLLPRFAKPLTSGIAHSDLVIFDHLAQVGLHENPDTVNRTTLHFLLRHHS